MIRNLDPHAGRDRAISTVLDAAIFLLLVSAAIGLFYTIPESDEAGADPDVAAETTTTLATSTETIEYRPAPSGDVADGTANRTDRGTVAELLAEATVANARLGGEPLTHSPNHEAAVRNATSDTVRQFGGDVEVQVRTRWRPLGASGPRGGIVVGPSPPTDADVHAATMAVPVGTGGVASPGSHSGRTVTSSCRSLAGDVASQVVGTAFPPERTALAMRVPSQQADLLRTRYRVAARGIGLDPASFRTGMGVRSRNELLADGLSRPLEAACEGYDSPANAAEHVAADTVLVSVRTWSP